MSQGKRFVYEGPKKREGNGFGDEENNASYSWNTSHQQPGLQQTTSSFSTNVALAGLSSFPKTRNTTTMGGSLYSYGEPRSKQSDNFTMNADNKYYSRHGGGYANNQVNQEVRQQNSTVSKVLSQRVTSGDTDWLTSNRTQNDGNLLNNKSANFKSNREHLDNGMYSKNDSDEWQTWQSPSVGHNGVKTVKSDNDGDPFIDNKTSSGSWMINSKNNSSGMRDIWNF